jgi:ferritin-like metal-binding protein YciE
MAMPINVALQTRFEKAAKSIHIQFEPEIMRRSFSAIPHATRLQLTRHRCHLRGKFLRSEEVMTKNSLEELYVDELKDLFSAETQLTKALPKMAKAATSEELRQGFEEHLEQTKGHVERLQQIFDELGEKATGKKCMGMEGLVKEGAEVIDEDYGDAMKDAALISAAQRVEHYEMAGYGSVIAYAELLGHSEQASLLKETLEEEKETDEKLTELSKEVNAQAQQGDEQAEQHKRIEDQPKAKRKTKAA